MLTMFASIWIIVNSRMSNCEGFKLFFSSTRKKLEKHIQQNFDKNEIIAADHKMRAPVPSHWSAAPELQRTLYFDYQNRNAGYSDSGARKPI